MKQTEQKIFVRVASMLLLLMASVQTALAQRLEVVDAEGHGIPLVSVLTEDGVLIGTTDMSGVLADMKGAAKVAVTHVAYKPQLVSVASLQNGRIVMESVDYGLDEVVVMPKPYLYVEYYYRAFRYVGDSLRAYCSGIIPATFDIRNKYKGKTRTIWSYGAFANKAPSWHAVHALNRAVDCVKNSRHTMAEKWLKEEQGQEKYRASIVADSSNSWRVEIPNQVVGQIVHANGISRTTVDAARMQMYSNEIHGETKMLKKRQEREYAYQYAEIFQLDDDEDTPDIVREVMKMHHWEYNSSKGRDINVYYIYTADHGYVDEAEFKARSKELNKGRAGDMTFEELQAYAAEHHIPELAPMQIQAIQELKKGQGK
jgi:hypothetical protein